MLTLGPVTFSVTLVVRLAKSRRRRVACGLWVISQATRTLTTDLGAIGPTCCRDQTVSAKFPQAQGAGPVPRRERRLCCHEFVAWLTGQGM
jgi:hypothetical protein